MSPLVRLFLALETLALEYRLFPFATRSFGIFRRVSGKSLYVSMKHGSHSGVARQPLTKSQLPVPFSRLPTSLAFGKIRLARCVPLS
jgi:hypothetical protein